MSVLIISAAGTCFSMGCSQVHLSVRAPPQNFMLINKDNISLERKAHLSYFLLLFFSCTQGHMCLSWLCCLQLLCPFAPCTGTASRSANPELQQHPSMLASVSHAGLPETRAIMNEESLTTVIMLTRITSGQEMRLSS